MTGQQGMLTPPIPDHTSGISRVLCLPWPFGWGGGGGGRGGWGGEGGGEGCEGGFRVVLATECDRSRMWGVGSRRM